METNSCKILKIFCMNMCLSMLVKVVDRRSKMPRKDRVPYLAPNFGDTTSANLRFRNKCLGNSNKLNSTHKDERAQTTDAVTSIRLYQYADQENRGFSPGEKA